MVVMFLPEKCLCGLARPAPSSEDVRVYIKDLAGVSTLKKKNEMTNGGDARQQILCLASRKNKR